MRDAPVFVFSRSKIHCLKTKMIIGEKVVCVYEPAKNPEVCWRGHLRGFAIPLSTGFFFRQVLNIRGGMS
jgi:hypothetical protein